MNPTAIRQVLTDRLAELGDVKVLLAPTEYGTSFGSTDELRLVVRILVGPPSPEAEEAVDDLFETVPQAVAEDRTLGQLVGDSSVRTCTGHRLFSSGPDVPPTMGAEWTVQVIA